MNTYNELLSNIKSASSDEDVVSAVLSKSRKIKRRKTRFAFASVLIFTTLAVSTLTVGAVNDWDYTTVLQRIFTNNQTVAESMESDINYKIVNNTYKDITFELSALYTDTNSLFMIVDVISEKPMFYEHLEFGGGSIPSILKLVPGGQADLPINDFSCYVVDENRMIVVFFFTKIITAGEHPDYTGYVLYPIALSEAVEDGREFALLFGKGGFSLSGGSAELRFTIDKISEQNNIVLNPDLPLENGNVLKEARITPFNIVLSYEKETVDKTWVEKISIIMKDGEERKLDAWSYDEGWAKSISGGHFSEYENYSWIAFFHHDKLLDLDEVATIVFDGTPFPIVR
ncbi:MAG: hypothetical protein FWD44_06640 [Oscillospiraceae bacterium]|nr:hypothetical protein [Oscillospiraceae bacterium]